MPPKSSSPSAAAAKRCVSCQADISKYKCPACFQPYCSVPCYSAHLQSSWACLERDINRKRQRAGSSSSSCSSSLTVVPPTGSMPPPSSSSPSITNLSLPSSSSSSSSLAAPPTNHPYGLLPASSIRSNARLHYQVALYALLDSSRLASGAGASAAAEAAESSGLAVWKRKFGDEDPTAVSVSSSSSSSPSTSSSSSASSPSTSTSVAAVPPPPISHYLPPPDSLTSHLPLTLPTPSMLSLLDSSSSLRRRLAGPDPSLRLLLVSLLEAYDKWLKGRYEVFGRGKDSPECRRKDVEDRLKDVRDYGGGRQHVPARGEPPRTERETMLDNLNLVDAVLVEIGACTMSDSGRIEFGGVMKS